MAMTTGGIVAVVIICILYFGFLFTASALIIKNKLRFRRNKKRLLAASEYQALQSDIELEEQSGPKKDDNNMIPQLPTDDDGGEDLKGKPRLEFEGNPLHQLDGNDTERPRAPYELENSTLEQGVDSEMNHGRRPTP